MATQTIKLVTYAGWTSPTIQLRNGTTDAAVGSAVSATINSTGTIYSGVFTDVPAGLYRVTLISGGIEVATGWVDLTLTTATFWSRVDRETASSGSGDVSSFSGDAATSINYLVTQAGLITAGQVNVLGGAVIGNTLGPLYVGDNYVGDKKRQIVISDAGETIKNELQDAGIASVLFGAGEAAADEVTGTIDSDDITHASDVTTIPVTIPTVTKCGNMTYHIKTVDTSNNEAVVITGTVTVLAERRSV